MHFFNLIIYFCLILFFLNNLSFIILLVKAECTISWTLRHSWVRSSSEWRLVEMKSLSWQFLLLLSFLDNISSTNSSILIIVGGFASFITLSILSIDYFTFNATIAGHSLCSESILTFLTIMAWITFISGEKCSLLLWVNLSWQSFIFNNKIFPTCCWACEFSDFLLLKSLN